VENTSDLTV